MATSPPCTGVRARTRGRRSYTLIELIVTVAILGALTAIALVAYTQVRNTAHDRATEAKLSQMAKAGLAERLFNTGTTAFAGDKTQFEGPAEQVYGQKMTFIPGDSPSTEQGTVSLAIHDTATDTVLVSAAPAAEATGDMAVMASLSPSGNCSFAILTSGGDVEMWSEDTLCQARGMLQAVRPEAGDEPTDGESTDPGAPGDGEEPGEGTPTDAPGEDEDPATGEEGGPDTGDDEGDDEGGIVAGPFEKAIFSAGSMTTTNTFRLLGGHSGTGGLYTGGDFTCNSETHIEGDLLTLGTLGMTNRCTVTGDATAGGDITTSTTTVEVGRTLRSHGSIRFGNSGLRIGEAIEAGGQVISSDGRPVATTSGHAPREHVGDLPDLPVETMPVLRHTPDLSQRTWSQMVNDSAAANQAPTWSDARKPGTCAQLSSASYSLNGPLRSPAGQAVIDATGCSDITLNDVDLRLRGDLTIYARSLTSSNGLRVTSADGATHALRIIIPFPQGQSSCAADTGKGGKNKDGAGTLTFNSGGTTIPGNVKVLLYSAGTVRLTNTLDMHGQIYGCRVSADSATTVRYARVAPPGY